MRNQTFNTLNVKLKKHLVTFIEIVFKYKRNYGTSNLPPAYLKGCSILSNQKKDPDQNKFSDMGLLMYYINALG